MTTLADGFPRSRLRKLNSRQRRELERKNAEIAKDQRLAEDVEQLNEIRKNPEPKQRPGRALSKPESKSPPKGSSGCPKPFDRTHFFIPVALEARKRGGIALGALLYYLAICRASKARPQVRTCCGLGAQIGLKRQRVLQLLGASAKFVEYERTMRGIRIWLRPEMERLASGWLHKPEGAVGFYRLSAAAKWGYAGAIILEYLDPEPSSVASKLLAEDEGIAARRGPQTAATICKCFRYLEPDTVRRLLARLANSGVLRRQEDGYYVLASSRWGTLQATPKQLNRRLDEFMKKHVPEAVASELRRLKELRRIYAVLQGAARQGLLRLIERWEYLTETSSGPDDGPCDKAVLKKLGARMDSFLQEFKKLETELWPGAEE